MTNSFNFQSLFSLPHPRTARKENCYYQLMLSFFSILNDSMLQSTFFILPSTMDDLGLGEQERENAGEWAIEHWFFYIEATQKKKR